MAKVCAQPGCPTIVQSAYCDGHKPKPWSAKEGAGARRRGKSGWAWQRAVRRILKRDRYICHWCRGLAVTADHVTPVAEGGGDEDANLVAACHRCNDRRMRELIARRRVGTPCASLNNRSGERTGTQKMVRTG